MKKLFLGAALAASMLVAAPAANAAVYNINLALPAAEADGTISAAFSQANIAGGVQEFYITFTLPTQGATTINLIGSGVNALTNFKFDTVTLDNVANFTLTPSGKFAELDQYAIGGGLHTLYLKGTSGGNGAFSGTLTFASAVPEPATWAMMIIGFSGAGVAIRRRRRDTSAALA